FAYTPTPPSAIFTLSLHDALPISAAAGEELDLGIGLAAIRFEVERHLAVGLAHLASDSVIRRCAGRRDTDQRQSQDGRENSSNHQCVHSHCSLRSGPRIAGPGSPKRTR